MAKKRSVSDLLDELRGSAEAAAIFEAIAEQAAAAAQREWWSDGAGEEGAMERGFARDAQRLVTLADALREKYHERCTKAAGMLRDRVSSA